MVSRRLRYTWWAAPRSQVGPPTFQGTSREALCVHLCRLRGVVFSPGSSTYNREQEGSAAAILSRVPCPLHDRSSNRFFASSLFFILSLPACLSTEQVVKGNIRRKEIRCVEREWCEERILIFSLAGTEVIKIIAERNERWRADKGDIKLRNRLSKRGEEFFVNLRLDRNRNSIGGFLPWEPVLS